MQSFQAHLLASDSFLTGVCQQTIRCWHPNHDSVTVEMVIGNLQKNAASAQKVIQEVVRRLHKNPPESEAHSALKYPIITPLDKAPAETKKKLSLLLEKYL